MSPRGSWRPLLDRADREAGEIVVAVPVVLRHLRGLAPEQRAPGLAAAVGDARDDRWGGVLVELAGCEVVEHEQRLRALRQEVVDAHRDQVEPGDLMAAALRFKQLQLGADAVGRRDQQRLLEARRAQVEQAAEAAELSRWRRSARLSAPAVRSP